jgi:hypothetical protein
LENQVNDHSLEGCLTELIVKSWHDDLWIAGIKLESGDCVSWVGEALEQSAQGSEFLDSVLDLAVALAAFDVLDSQLDEADQVTTSPASASTLRLEFRTEQESESGCPLSEESDTEIRSSFCATCCSDHRVELNGQLDGLMVDGDGVGDDDV